MQVGRCQFCRSNLGHLDEPKAATATFAIHHHSRAQHFAVLGETLPQIFLRDGVGQISAENRVLMIGWAWAPRPWLACKLYAKDPI